MGTEQSHPLVAGLHQTKRTHPTNRPRTKLGPSPTPEAPLRQFWPHPGRSSCNPAHHPTCTKAGCWTEGDDLTAKPNKAHAYVAAYDMRRNPHMLPHMTCAAYDIRRISAYDMRRNPHMSPHMTCAAYDICRICGRILDWHPADYDRWVTFYEN